MPVAQVAADREPCVAVDASLSLLEVDGIGRRVPVNDGVAPPVEVDAFLTHARRGEHPWPEGAVEGRTNLGKAGRLVRLAHCAVSKCEPASEADSSTWAMEGEGGLGRRAQRKRAANRLREGEERFVIDGSGEAFCDRQVMNMFIEHCLQVAPSAICEHCSPVHVVR